MLNIPAHITTEEQYDTFLPIIERLHFKASLTVEEDIIYNHLVSIIEEYEELHYPMGKSTIPEILQHIIESSGIELSKLAEIMNVNLEELDEVLEGKVTVTREQAEALGDYFKADYSLFIEED